MKINDLKLLIYCLIVCLGAGMISGLITSGSASIYSDLILPEVHPPGYLFPLVWTILYILMAISLYMVVRTSDHNNREQMIIFFIQLLLNFVWAPVFFVIGNYLAAFIILVALWVSVLMMIISFNKKNRNAALLQIPYIIWITFAGYLSYSVYVLN